MPSEGGYGDAQRGARWHESLATLCDQVPVLEYTWLPACSIVISTGARSAQGTPRAAPPRATMNGPRCAWCAGLQENLLSREKVPLPQKGSITGANWKNRRKMAQTGHLAGIAGKGGVRRT